MILEAVRDGDAGPLAGCSFAHQEKKFKGCSQMVDPKVMKKISDMDPDFLDGEVSRQRSINDCLSGASS